MSTEETDTGGGGKHVTHGSLTHPHDEDVKKIAITGAWLAGLVIVVHLLLLWLFSAYQRSERRGDAPVHPMLESSQVPPEPRLQEKPWAELDRVRDEERQLLEGYGWVDRQGSVIRIPVDRAMELLLQRGLPVRTK